MFSTLKELYDNTVTCFAERPSFTLFEREEMNYAELALRVSKVRSMLSTAGLRSGDKVALLSNNMPNWGVCYFAVVTAGMVVVPILPDFSGEELDMIIEHSESKALLVSDKLYGKLSHTTIERMNVVIRTKNLGEIARNVELPPCRFDDPTPEQTASIIYTSGTTSRPKGVMLSHRALCAQVDMAYELFPVKSDDVFLSILPLSHAYECSIGMLYPFSAGAAVVYLDRPPTASNLMPAFGRVRPTVFLNVPLIIEKVYKSQVLGLFNSTALLRMLYRNKTIRLILHRRAGKRLEKAFGGRIRFFGIGGAKLDPSTEQFLSEARFPYAIGYGLTETAPLLAGAVPFKTRLQSTGPALSRVKLRLDNVNPATGEGEVVALTPSIMEGYYKNEQATSEAFTQDGWFRTKDLGMIDSDGYLFVKGRLGNMIVGASGENIYPEEIESVLNTHSLVNESIVIEEKGKLVALVSLDKAALEQHYHDFKDQWTTKVEEVKEDIQKYVNSKVGKFSHISMVMEQSDGFEKTPTQKIKRYLYTHRKIR